MVEQGLECQGRDLGLYSVGEVIKMTIWRTLNRGD